jgi:hypothetical protein
MLNKGKIIKGVFAEIGYVLLFIFALFGIAWLI